MASDLILFVLLVIALGIGYWLGVRQRQRQRSASPFDNPDYIESLNHLLNERHDLAIDSFVERMAEDSNSVDTHLALASLVRRRGDVDKATSIHQQLLDGGTLTAQQRRQCELELARDYHAAGLFDRAETLLLKFTNVDCAERPTAGRWLLDIYEREKDWQRAADTGRRLLTDAPELAATIAHFECELAAQHLAAGEMAEAQAALSRARQQDPGCARAPLLGAELELAAGSPKTALAELHQVCDLDPELLGETLPLFARCCAQLGDDQAYLDTLRRGLQTTGAAAVVEHYAAHLQQSENLESGIGFRLTALGRHPDPLSFKRLLELLAEQGRGLDPAELSSLLVFADSLLAAHSAYRCRQCGFGSGALMWQCPSCRSWGQLKPRRTAVVN